MAMVSSPLVPSTNTILGNLRLASRGLDRSLMRLSTGTRVATAADDAALWSMATTMRSDNAALKAINEGLDTTLGLLDVTRLGLEKTIDLISEVRARLVLARQPGTDMGKVNSEITALKQQMKTVAASSSYAGKNLLYGDGSQQSSTMSFDGSLTRTANGDLAMTSISMTTFYLNLYDTGPSNHGWDGLLTGWSYYPIPGISGSGNAWFSMLNEHARTWGITLVSTWSGMWDEQIAGMLDYLDDCSNIIRDNITAVAGTQNTAMAQQAINRKRMDSTSAGLSILVDANMEEEAARLRALETRQGLAYRQLSIVNASRQNLLTLFS